MSAPEDTPKMEDEEIPLSEVVEAEANNLPHEETEFDSSLTDEDIKKAISNWSLD